MLRLAAALAAWLGASAFLGAGASMAADADKAERTVSVSATGWVTAEPDVASITAGVVTDADTAKDAIARNSAIMAKVIDGLKAAGIAAKDMYTAQLDVAPRYTQAKEGRAPTINGYRVSNEVRLTVRDVNRLGDLLDRAISLGANEIREIAFDVAEPEPLQDEARKQAMDNARRLGELYAKAAGVQLGPVLRITEGPAGLPQVRRHHSRRLKAAVPIEAGTLRVGIQVNVVYALR
jgi:uncharacterized protein YggE